MKYKITYRNKSYIVKAKDTQSALNGLSVIVPELRDDRLSPMTYRKLKELGYTHEKWKDLTQEEANKIVARGTQSSTSSAEKPDESKTKNNMGNKLTAEQYKARVAKYAEQSKPFADKLSVINKTKEAQDFIKSLAAGKYYSLDELKGMKILQETDRLIDEYNQKFGDSVYDNSPEREEEREYIKNTLLSRGSYNGKDANGKPRWDGELKHEGKVVIAIGLPASGKSTVIAEPRSKEMGAYILDSDEAKFLDPRFVASGGIAADSIHKDSQNITKNVMNELVKNKTNLVIPIIGSDYEKIKKKWLQPLLDAGYKPEDIEFELKEGDTTQSSNRVLRRQIEKNRPIKSDIILGYENPRGSFEAAKADGYKATIHK